MSAGTLTLTNNSDTVTGVGTTFTTELAAGDFVVTTVGGITYTLPVKSIGSGTQLVLVSKYSGPTQAGAAWQAVPRAAQNQITAELVAQTTAALRGLNYDKQNWQAVFSASGDITVVLPDGSTFTGPSWQSIKDTLALIDIDAVTALANQVHTDAQQVAADKTTATQAASTATQAKTDSQTAQAAAETAAAGAGSSNASAAQHASDAAGSATAAAGSATAAANSAASIHPENILHKDQNLDDLADKSAARSHLDVYSKAETDGKDSDLSARMESINTDLLAKSVVTNARIDKTTLSVTNPALGSRTVIQNPYGNNTPVMCVAEIFHATLQKWISFPWVFNGVNATTSGNVCSYSEGDGIVLQLGKTAYVSVTSAGGSSGNITTDYTTPSPVRIHIWKVMA